jgi:glycosyltransferase involved in cell wall biosynthesis
MALKRQVLKKIIRQVDLLLTANRLGVAYWRYYGAPRSKIEICPYYSDYARIDAARGRARQEVLGRIGLRAEDRVLFSAARLVPDKGLDLAIRAFRTLGLGAREWKYVIAGIGPLEKELQALAGEELGKTIHFVGFQQPTENLALMAQAKMLLLPSRYEPHGIVVAEALAAGTPVMASDVVGAAYDLVNRGVSGLIFRSGDEGDLAAKLRSVTEGVLGGELLERLQAGARPAFEAWYRLTSPTVVVPVAVRRMLAGRVAGGENRRV